MDNLIVITRPERVADEASLVELMLRKGIDRVHVRKSASEDAEALVAAIEPGLRPRLSVHYYPDLAEKYGCGLHLNSRVTHGRATTLSRSCHSVAELADDVDYQFLSPIYDSISKEGYTSRFNLKELTLPANVYALGGVTPAHFEELDGAGFCGAAMLGYIWADLNIETIKERIDAAIYYSHKL